MLVKVDASRQLDEDIARDLKLLPNREPIYIETPKGHIDLPGASQKYGVKLTTLRYWLRQGHIKRVGRLKAPAPGGGYVVVKESDIVKHVSAPKKKGGRPRKALCSS